MLVVNLIDKDRIRGDEGFGDSRAVWRARLFLFIGFALMAGGLAGSIVRPLPPPLFLNFNLSNMRLIAVDSGVEIRPPRLSGAVHLLRLRQRLAERRHDVIGRRPLDRTEWQQRVRVQPHPLNASSYLRTSSSSSRIFMKEIDG